MADIRLIRAKRNIFVPHDPENPDKNSMRLVQTGLIALVPNNFELPKDYYLDLGKVQVKKDKKLDAEV